MLRINFVACTYAVDNRNSGGVAESGWNYCTHLDNDSTHDHNDSAYHYNACVRADD